MNGREADPLRLLRETVVGGEDPRAARHRGEVVGREVAAAIRAIPARRRAARVRLAAAGASTVAFAAMGAAAMLWMRLPESTLSGRGFAARPSAAGAPAPARTAAFMPGDEVVTRGGAKTTFDLPGGASIALSPQSRVRWLSEPRVATSELRLALAQGRVDLRVPALPSDGSLVVSTPHAELVLRGTALMINVMKAPDRGEGTCVAVSEGTVTVRARGEEAKVFPGGTWSSFVDRSLCGIGFATARPPAETATPAPAKLAAPAGRKGKTPPASASRQSRAPSGTSLALENRLFHAAALAHQRGDDAEAIRLFDELVRTYPDSALVPEALETRRRAAERLEGDGRGR